VLYNKELKQKFYLLPTGDGYNSLLLTPLTDGLRQKLYNNNNICNSFYELYSVKYINTGFGAQM
jgi:hypothetical protein